MTDPFKGLLQGYEASQQIQQAPQLNQLNLLQEQAKLEQLKGLDPLSQQQISESQARTEGLTKEQEQEARNIVGTYSYLAKQMQPEQKEMFFNALGKMGVDMLGLSPEELEETSVIGESLIKKVDPKPYQQATGKGLEGYVFDPNTGSFYANPAIRQKISALSQKPDLKMSDVRDINNDVTKLTQQAREARDGANALINIGDKPTPAQAVAAIFKFMKSLDPTSVVRQEEQGLVASASGPMEAFAGYINRLTGSGPLTTEVMQDIISTASGIANSTINESKTVVEDFINVYPELDDKRRSSMLGRVPDLLNPPSFKQKIPDLIPETMRDRFSNLPESEQKKVIERLEKKSTSGQGKR